MAEIQSSTASEKPKIVKLQSKDEKIFDVEEEIVKLSKTLADLLINLPQGENGNDTDDSPIPIPNVDGTILTKVIEWAKHHKDDPPLPDDEDDEERERRYTDEIPEWDKTFLNVDQSTIFELILAANYLDIKGLLDVTCQTVANMIKGKTPEEIRKQFDIENDFTPEEEERIRKENEWLEEK